MNKKGLNYLIFIVAMLCWAVFLVAIAEMPPMGDPNNITNTHVIPRYIEKSIEEGGASNMVTSIILNYRGYDTSFEVVVIFTALISILAVLKRENIKTSKSLVDASPVRASVIVSTVVKFLTPFIILYAIYMILHGDVSPGGGFQGGAIIGGSIIAFTLTFGLLTSMKKFRLSVRVPLETSAVLAFRISGIVGMFVGVPFLTFLIPGLTHEVQEFVRHSLLIIIEIGIGIATGIIFASIFAAMGKVEG
ncbi:MAG: MnhB domain-containing protein [Candidatus Subteraquimicrobiales bacterium]|nr:MnhB domain-containing protein [Candidatus Subteraquimicrobiales bacterium]